MNKTSMKIGRLDFGDDFFFTNRMRKPIESWHDETRWQVRFTNKDYEVVFVDLQISLTDDIPNAFTFVAGPFDPHPILVVRQVGDNQFIVGSGEEGHIDKLYFLRLAPNGVCEVTTNFPVEDCWWLIRDRILVSKSGSSTRFYSIPLQADLEWYITKQIGQGIKCELINAEKSPQIVYLRTKEVIEATFTADTLKPVYNQAHSISTDKVYEIADFSSFAEFVRDEIYAEKFRDYLITESQSSQRSSDDDWACVAEKNIANLKSELLKRGGLTEAEYRFDPWPVAKGVFRYDEARYAIARPADGLVLTDLAYHATVVINSFDALSNGFCAGLVQISSEGDKSVFLVAMNCKIIQLIPEYKESLDVYRIEVKYIPDCNTLGYQITTHLHVENADCLWSDKYLCTDEGLYSIEDDKIKNNYLHIKQNTYGHHKMALDLNGRVTPAVLIVFGEREKAVYAIIRLDTLEVAGGIAYDQGSRSFVPVQSVTMCERIVAGNNYRETGKIG